jgi:deoxyribose-phosphate aldolase
MEAISNLCSEIIAYNRPACNADNLRFLYSAIDLTNLNSFALQSDIETLCHDALLREYEGIPIQHVAAVCVYPVYVLASKKLLGESDINIATVTACFPHAQSFSQVKYLETELALQHGANEIDVVLNLSAFLNKNESLAFDEIKTIKQICGNNHLKVILETALLKEKSIIEQASIMALEAGADFIKTSTGKDGSLASLEAVYIMCQVLKNYKQKTNRQAGLKPAGGISTTDEALNYMSIVNEVLGKDWLTPEFFRIGASRLAKNLLKDIQEYSE